MHRSIGTHCSLPQSAATEDKHQAPLGFRTAGPGGAVQALERPMLGSCSLRFNEGPKGSGLVVFNIENRIQLCFVHHFLHVFCRAEQL